MSRHFVVAPFMPQRPALISPSTLPPRAAASSAPLPWHTGIWQGDCRSGPVRGPACCIGRTVGGGGFPIPYLPRCRGHASAVSAPALLSSSPLSPGIPPLGSFAGLPSLVMSFRKSVARPPRPGFFIFVMSSPPSHVDSSDDSSVILPPSTPRTPCMIPVPSGAPCTWGLPL